VGTLYCHSHDWGGLRLTLLYFIIAISILVVIHEYGHFWVARRAGVKVLRFSVGFGKPLFSFSDRHGTEFSVAPIPLGGYVKMLDRREAPVPEQLQAYEFNSKSPLARIAIAAAGPIANFLFAILVYTLLFWGGTTSFVPVVGQVDEQSIAAEAGFLPGDEFIEINGKAVGSWQDVNWAMLSYIGETRDLPVVVRRGGAESQTETLNLKLTQYLGDTDAPAPIQSLGIAPRLPDVPLEIAQVMPDSAAEAAGLMAGDLIVSANGEAITDWRQWVMTVRNAADQTLRVGFEREGLPMTLDVTPKAITTDDGQTIGQIGVMPVPPEIPESWQRHSEPGLWLATQQGVAKTWQLVVFTLDSLWKMITGDVSVKNLSGPITIAKVAGDSASGGLIVFANFLALLSVSLGVLNLLPVPMLDGGHILFYLAEIVRGKPLPESVQIAAVKVGMVLLLMLMSIAFYNDISRL